MVCAQLLSRIRLSATPWTVAQQAPLSMGFPRQGYGSGLLFLPQGIFRTLGLNPHLLCLLHWQAGFLALRHLGSPALLYGCFLTFLKTLKISTSLHGPATWKGFLHLVNSYLLFQAHVTPGRAVPTQLTPVTSVLGTSFSILPLKARVGPAAS